LPTLSLDWGSFPHSCRQVPWNTKLRDISLSDSQLDLDTQNALARRTARLYTIIDRQFVNHCTESSSVYRLL
jgi:hypothetical protein